MWMCIYGHWLKSYIYCGVESKHLMYIQRKASTYEWCAFRVCMIFQCTDCLQVVWRKGMSGAHLVLAIFLFLQETKENDILWYSPLLLKSHLYRCNKKCFQWGNWNEGFTYMNTYIKHCQMGKIMKIVVTRT
jgi:hypothetical protein